VVEVRPVRRRHKDAIRFVIESSCLAESGGTALKGLLIASARCFVEYPHDEAESAKLLEHIVTKSVF
jgi:hypothetical protein